MQLYVSTIHLTLSKEEMTRFVTTWYNRYFKKDRILHVTGNDDRYTSLKITEDVATFRFFFPHDDGLFSLICDGKYDEGSDTLTFYSITPDVFEELTYYEYKTIEQHLLEWSKVADGVLLLSIDGKPKRIRRGQVENANALTNELASWISPDKKEDAARILELFLDSFDYRP